MRELKQKIEEQGIRVKERKVLLDILLEDLAIPLDDQKKLAEKFDQLSTEVEKAKAKIIAGIRS